MSVIGMIPRRVPLDDVDVTPAPARLADERPRARVVRAHEGVRRAVLDEQVVVKVDVHQSRGAYAMFEVTVPPGAGAPLHRERFEDETFVILAGALTFVIAGEPVVAGVGDTVCIPRGVAHGYANRGATDARALVVAAPGRAKERMFTAIDALMQATPEDEPPDVEEVAAVCGVYGVELVGRP